MVLDEKLHFFSSTLNNFILLNHNMQIKPFKKIYKVNNPLTTYSFFLFQCLQKKDKPLSHILTKLLLPQNGKFMMHPHKAGNTIQALI